MDNNKKFQIVLGVFLLALVIYMSYMAYGLFKGDIKSVDPKSESKITVPVKTSKPTVTTVPASSSN
ncbi:MAG: hypothetical protein QMB63_00080 [Clostridiaceae bacterium]